MLYIGHINTCTVIHGIGTLDFKIMYAYPLPPDIRYIQILVRIRFRIFEYGIDFSNPITKKNTLLLLIQVQLYIIYVTIRLLHCMHLITYS